MAFSDIIMRDICANEAQTLLYIFRYDKNSEFIINTIREVIRLVKNGLDKRHVDNDGRNLMDYVQDYGWKSFIIDDYTFFQKLKLLGFTNRTGKKSSIKDDIFVFNKTCSVSKVLYDNRYLKDIYEQNLILLDIKRKSSGYKVARVKDIYEKFCVYGFWRDSIIADFLRDYH
jgi:hypothetical protein